MKVFFTLLFVIFLTSCAPKPEPVLDHGTVVAKNASLRLKNSSTSRTIRVLDTGDKVEVLERQENWYRVRYGTDIQGWMETSTVLTNGNKDRIQTLVASSQNQGPQNTAVLKQAANFRLEPGRSTAIWDEARSDRTRHIAPPGIAFTARRVAESTSVTY